MPSKGVLYLDVPQVTLAGVPIYTDSSPPEEACCCPDAGCCTGDVLDTDVFEAEVTAATNNCVPVGASVQLDPSGGFIWDSVDCLDATCFNGLELTCASDEIGFVLTGDGTVCVAANPCPDVTAYTTELISLTCDPFEAIFLLTLTLGIPPQCGCCDANVGEVTIRVTKVP